MFPCLSYELLLNTECNLLCKNPCAFLDEILYQAVNFALLHELSEHLGKVAKAFNGRGNTTIVWVIAFPVHFVKKFEKEELQRASC